EFVVPVPRYDAEWLQEIKVGPDFDREPTHRSTAGLCDDDEKRASRDYFEALNKTLKSRDASIENEGIANAARLRCIAAILDCTSASWPTVPPSGGIYENALREQDKKDVPLGPRLASALCGSHAAKWRALREWLVASPASQTHVSPAFARAMGTLRARFEDAT